MKRILFVGISLNAGGAERVIKNISEYLLTDEDLEINVLTLASSKFDFYVLDKKINRVELDFDVKLGKYALLRKFKRIMKLRKTVREINPDIIVSFMTFVNIILLVSLLGTHYKVIVSERNNPNIGLNQWSIRKIRFLYNWRNCRKVVVQTSSVKNWYTNQIKSKLLEIVEIENFVNVQKINSLKTQGYREDRKYKLCAIGRLHDQKGFDLLIKALSLSNFFRYNCKLNIYGEGEKRVELQKLIDASKLTGIIELKGRSDDIYTKIYLSDIFILSSRYEGFPNALIEAMACGKVCISVNCDFGPADIIKNNDNGILIDNDNLESINYHIEHILNDHVRKKRIEEAALATIRNKFDDQVVMPKWKSLIDESLRSNDAKYLRS